MHIAIEQTVCSWIEM